MRQTTPSILRRTIAEFWRWYDRTYALNVGASTALFVLQAVHLYWLTTHVVALRLFGTSFFHASPAWHILIALVDYTEIPVLFSTSFVYIHALRTRRTVRSILMLLLLNIQWIHLFWITDEFVLRTVALNAWLAWVAILIDYLEIPVMLDMLRKSIRAIRRILAKNATYSLGEGGG
jgi:hypothetical protein